MLPEGLFDLSPWLDRSAIHRVHHGIRRGDKPRGSYGPLLTAHRSASSFGIRRSQFGISRFSFDDVGGVRLLDDFFGAGGIDGAAAGGDALG